MEMLIRTITSILVAPLIIAAAWFGGIPLLLLVLLAAIIANREFNGLSIHAGYRPSAFVSMSLSLALVLDAYFSWNLALPILIFGLISGIVWCRPACSPPRSFVGDWSSTLIGALYSGGLLSYGVLLRALPDGLGWGLITLFGTWSCDTTAYLIGSRWGQHKLAPTISPGKTWEGAIGGFLCSLATVLLVAFIFRVPLVHGLALGILVPFAVTAGDLTESMLKRSAGVKDAGDLIPGHGGLLDRIDGLLFAIVTVYYYVTKAVGA